MKRLYILLIICAAWLPLKAQVNVSIQILPPYPTKITDYASHPQLMVIAVTNASTTTQRIQLRGAVTGDNGIELRVKDTYKSVTPIELGPGQVRMLNGNDLKYFFDYTRITYKGITQNDFISKNGLPEGTYRFCIRAYNYDTNVPISGDEPVGCSNSFTISSLEPPMLMSPAADASISSKLGQTILFSWTTPPGTSPQIMSSVRYRVRMVEIIGDKNPNNAIMSATTPAFFEKEVMGNNLVYGPGEPQLTPGRKYAFMVEAFDPFNGTPFRNHGRSEVRAFTYAAPPAIVNTLTPPGTTQHTIMGTVPTGLNCDCKANAGTGNSNNALVTPNAVINVGNYKMHVATVKLGTNGTVSGEGTMELPFVGATLGARLRVSFTNMDVDGQLKMKSGDVQGIVSGNAATLIPTADDPNAPNMQMVPSDATNLQQYFSTRADQMLSSLKTSGNTLGFELPLGISKGPVTIAISRIFFSATQAWFEAAAAVDIPDGGADNVLALSGRNICLGTAEKAFCKDGQLYLSKDFNIGFLGLVLKGAGADVNLDPGTSITFDNKGFKNLSIKGEYTFKEHSLTDAKTNAPLKVDFTAESTTGWTDWVATLQLPDFYVTGMNSISFGLGGKQMYYDHSDIKNPPNIPPSFASPDGNGDVINTSALTWHGFYIPEITVKMPGIIKSKQQGSDGTVGIQGKQLIYDDSGFTGTIQSTVRPLELGNGSMGGWYASIDNVNLQFYKSGFKQSSMTGRVVLPASINKDNANNQLTYNATLTTPSSSNGLAYSFNIVPTNNAISFDALFMSITLDGNTQILAEGNSATPFRAEMNLCGKLSLISGQGGVKIPGLGKINLPQLEFGNLKLQTDGDFINIDKFYFALTSGANGGNGGGAPGNSGFDDVPPQDEGIIGGPSAQSYATDKGDALGGFSTQQTLAGFKFSLASPGFKIGKGINGSGTGINMSFIGDVLLAEDPIACKATGTFTLSSSISKSDDRIKWDGIGGQVDSVSLGAAADLGAFHIKGAIKYYNRDNDEGFVGALETGIADFLTINMRAQFGMISNSSQGNYNYFNFNALADFGETGITFAPPIPIAFYGFGGGVYYNMDIVPNSLMAAANIPVVPKKSDTKTLPTTAKGSHDPNPADDALALLDYNPAGLKLFPSKGSFGLQATVLFGLTSRNTLDADATFSMGFYEGGGIRFVKLNSNARVLTDVSKLLPERKAASTGAGSMDIEFIRPENSFLARLTMAFGVPHVGDTRFLRATGGGEFYYAGKDDWHIKIGSPEGTQPGPDSLTILNFITGSSYFEVGTNLDPMPEIPADIRQLAGDQGNNLKPQPGASREYDPEATGQKSSGLILGSSVQLGDPNTEYHFLMFYGTLYARMGFDLSLLKGVSCDNVNAAGGPGGWYARGQAYFGAKAKIGIDVNLLLIHGKFTIFEAGAGAIIQAGLPNPAWAMGTVGGHFAILDGAISSDFHFGFSVGNKCINSNSDPFGGLEIISQVSPPKDGDKVKITTMPGVVFNVKNGGQYQGGRWINGDFEFDDYDSVDKYGNPKKRFFRFDKSCLDITLNGTSVKDKMVRLDSAFALGYQGNGYLAKNTQYNFKVVAKMLEGRGVLLNGSLGSPAILYDNYVKKPNTSIDATQEMETTFTTDSGFTAIPASEYAMTGPLHSDKVVPVQEFGGINGNLMYIESKKVIDKTNFFKYPEGTTYAARIFRNGVQDGADIPVTMQNVNARMNSGVPKGTVAAGDAANLYSDSHSRWTFPSPVLQKGSSYVVTVIAKLPQSNTGTNNGVGVTMQSTTFGNSINTKGINTSANTATSKSVSNNSRTMQANSDVLAAAGNSFKINVLTRTLATHLNSLAAGEYIAAAFTFSTSRYSTYSEKFSVLQINKLVDTSALSKTISPDRLPGQNLPTFKQWIPPINGIYTIKLGSGMGYFNFPVQVTFTGELFSKADIDGTSSDEVFQPDYDPADGPQKSFSIKSLYKLNPVTDYGAAYVKLRSFIAQNTSIPLTNINVVYTAPKKPADNGIIHSNIVGGEDITYGETKSNIGAKVPTTLPQKKNSAGQMSLDGTAIEGLLPGLPLLFATPVLYSSFTAETVHFQSLGQVTFTNEIQKQIDKMKNWAVNPGDNMSNVGNSMNTGTNVSTAGNGMSGVGVWESVSTAASGYMSGSINQGQLQGAIQGAAKATAGMRQ